jgi:uncharacterized delta-60 repeat protein
MRKHIYLLLIGLFVSAGFAADGDLDTSFGPGGFVNENFQGLSARHNSVVVQPDGKILAAGNSLNISNFTNDFAIVRYNPDGTLDTSFGTGGRRYADVGGRNDIMPTLLLQPDGKIVLVGVSKNELDRNITSIFRFNADGTSDTNFGTGGVALGSFTTSGTRGDTPSDALLQPDGKLVVAGAWHGTAFCVARFNANGAVDSNFGTGGNLCATTAPAGTGLMNSLALQPDGKLVVSAKFATSFTAPFDFIVFRFNADGTQDTSFDGDGYAITDFNAGYDDALSVHVLPDGKILAAGRVGQSTGTVYNFGLARYTATGALDASFDGDGKATAFPENTAGSEDYSSVLLASGKIVVGRYRKQASPGISTEGQIARFNPDGSVDASFGAGGQVVNAALKEIWDLAVQPDGKLVAVGWNQTNFSITARFLNTDSAPPVNNAALRIADFDGDGRTDASVFRSGTWFINPSSAPSLTAPNGFYGVQWGLASDKLAPADYDGDGKSDIAVWRESEANFYILNSSNGAVRVENFGLAGDVLTVGDWDGDGKADPAVYRDGAQSYFFYRGSLDNPSGNITYLPWGTAGDKAVRGDFDGDRKLDAAVYRASDQTWYIRRSSDNQAAYRVFGLAADKRVSGDFDGDGKTDICVFRDGTWYILQSSDNQIRYQNWGLASDTLAAGDYDGDGKTDIAVWRSGVYYILNSANGAVSYRYFGSNGDAAVASAFVQ